MPLKYLELVVPGSSVPLLIFLLSSNLFEIPSGYLGVYLNILVTRNSK